MPGQPPYNDLTYYTFSTPNGLKPSVVLEELGLQYKSVVVDITKNTQKEDWYLAINPNGRIPALKDGDMRVFESAAVMLYLTDFYDPERTISYPNGTPEYYEMMSWIIWSQSGLGPMQGQANHFRAMAGAYSAYGIKRYTDETKRLFDVLESRLSKAEWLAGDKYSLADIVSWSWVRAASIIELSLDDWPGITKWSKRIEERPAVKKAMEKTYGERTPEKMEEMFKSMRARVDAMKDTDKHDS